MSKYSYEFKMKAVQAYLNDEGSYEYLSKKYNLSDKHPLRIWVSSYKEFGKEDLMRSRQNKNYSLQFKLSVVELYLSSEVSYRELALSQGINNPSLPNSLYACTHASMFLCAEIPYFLER